MKISLVKEITNLSGWWTFKEGLIINNFENRGIRAYDRFLNTINNVSDVLSFECGSDELILCSNFETRRLSVCNYQGKILEEIQDIRYAFKSAYSQGIFFFLGSQSNNTRDKNWYSYNPKLKKYLLRKDIENETDVVTSICGIIWKQSHLSFVDVSDFGKELYSVPMEELIGTKISSPFDFKYIGIGRQFLVISNKKTKKIILINIEKEKIIFNKEHFEIISTDENSSCIYFWDKVGANIFSFSIKDEKMTVLRLGEKIDFDQNVKYVLKFINQHVFIFYPDAFIRIFDQLGNLVLELKLEDSKLFSARDLITSPVVKFLGVDLFCLRTGHDAFSPLRIYKIAY